VVGSLITSLLQIVECASERILKIGQYLIKLTYEVMKSGGTLFMISWHARQPEVLKTSKNAQAQY